MSSLKNFLKQASEETNLNLNLKKGDYIFLMVRESPAPIEGSFVYMDSNFILLKSFDSGDSNWFKEAENAFAENNAGYTIDFSVYKLKDISNITKYKKHAKKKT